MPDPGEPQFSRTTSPVRLTLDELVQRLTSELVTHFGTEVGTAMVDAPILPFRGSSLRGMLSRAFNEGEPPDRVTPHEGD